MRRVNLIPMAGQGMRFKEAGIVIPKPLIKVNGLPMVVRAAQCLPEADKWIFICRENHLRTTNIKKTLKFFFKNATIIGLKDLTAGQLSTCLIAKDYLKQNDKLTIGSCDNGMLYDTERYEYINNLFDILVWTFNQNLAVVNNPEMYSWAELNQSGLISRISCKKVISNNPINDLALTGAFFFKRAEIFLEFGEKVIEKQERINNEFYVDSVIDQTISEGYKVFPFKVDKYNCWGTPEDLELYEKQLNK